VNKEGRGCSETLPFKLQKAGSNQEESIGQSEQGETLKSRLIKFIQGFSPTQTFFFLSFSLLIGW
jgi:hypothetical protein